jgi:hypothetical protein
VKKGSNPLAPKDSSKLLFTPFAGSSLSSYLRENHQRLQSHIENEDENHLLNINETSYLEYLVSRFSVEPPQVDFDGLFVTHYEKQKKYDAVITNETLRTNQQLPIDVFVYHLPFKGNPSLLKVKPSLNYNFHSSGVQFFIEGLEVRFELENHNGADQVRAIASSVTKSLKDMLKAITEETENYNVLLLGSIKQQFERRKKRILSRHEVAASLGVPIKKRDDLPETYSIPTPQIRKQIAAKPDVKASGYQPEPVLDESIYQDIIQVLHGVGKVFERLPSTYNSKQEEELRDHFLLYLEPRYYDASVTGETFNKKGKTDILIRHENSNVFVAECKFWDGAKKYLDTISQLLGYLTWRDSKAAVIIFVRNKDFSSVLNTAEEVTPDHPNFLSFVGKVDETWLNYRFHINDDKNREVKLTILLFHLPQVD